MKILTPLLPLYDVTKTKQKLNYGIWMGIGSKVTLLQSASSKTSQIHAEMIAMELYMSFQISESYPMLIRNLF